MKIISWNVNGIRAVVKKGFNDFLIKQSPDILCLQEIKINDEARAKEQFDFKSYKEYWHSAERPGYSGTAVLVKNNLSVVSIKNGVGKKEFDREGRVQTIEFKNFFLVNAYFPNSNHELTRLGFKLDFNKSFLKYTKNLSSKKPVITTGDFNVAHQEIDLARPKDNVGNPGFTDQERQAMTKFLQAGFIDTFRYCHGNKIKYTWWSYRVGARAKNIGWRIDYFCVSKSIKNKIKKALILDQVMGSDHCPIGIEIKI
ncbi:MAG: exodeoxyribonuclease III [Patescibacteria group bacterium]|jgi:exodeoxyribonuclease-3